MSAFLLFYVLIKSYTVVCTGKYLDGTGASNAQSCLPCGTGKYASATINTQAANCQSCLAGKANPNTGSGNVNACVECVAGKYSAAAANSCASCHNTQNSLAGSTLISACKCNSGYTGPDGGLSCTQCASGKYKHDANPGVCTSCPVNTYNSIPGQSGSGSCSSCPLSSTTDGGAKTNVGDCKCTQGTSVQTTIGTTWVCNQCGVGKYSDQPHSSGCENCPLNTYQTTFGASNSNACFACPANSNSKISSGSQQDCNCNLGYSGVAGGLCTVCVHGKYSDSAIENNGECKQCISGKITDATGATALSQCVVCGVGKYASLDQSTCIDCPVDTYCSNGMQIMCTTFRTNTYNSIPASSNSNACLCVAGTFLSGNLCTACTVDFFCRGTDNSKTACPINSASIASSVIITACKCKPGHHGEDGTACSECVPGTYKVSEGNQACTACGVGFFSDGAARSIPGACLQCPVGKASNNAIAASCPACGAGKYSDTSGATICKDCQAGKWSSATMATSADVCQWCGAGKYQQNLGAVAESLCKVCPVGKTKSWGP